MSLKQRNSTLLQKKINYKQELASSLIAADGSVLMRKIMKTRRKAVSALINKPDIENEVTFYLKTHCNYEITVGTTLTANIDIKTPKLVT